MNIRGRTISVMTYYIGSQATHHLVLSFSFGGWKLLLDININALKQIQCLRAKLSIVYMWCLDVKM